MSLTQTRFTKALQLKYPLVVAPMAGGPSSVELVVASSEAGALGSIGAAYWNAAALREFTAKVQARTKRPIAINLFIPAHLPPVSEEALGAAVKATQKFRDDLGIAAPNLVPPYEENFDEQFEAALAMKPAVVSFVFGLLPPSALKEAKKRGAYLIGTATTPEEAEALADSGVDAAVLQGVEAGGHRGIFQAESSDPQISTLDLLAQTKRRIKLPLIAAGGLMSAQDIEAALRCGADAVQMGTAFLATEEAGTSAPYRAKLLEAPTRATQLTRAFSGRWARGLTNRFMRELAESSVLPFPAQNKFTRDLRSASLAKNSADFLSLWCGTGAGDLWTGSTKALIESLFPQP
jgi:nitronate monooxygenase